MTSNPALPNMEKPVTSQKCQTIYLNLLDALSTDKTFSTPTFVRELWQTKRCDQYHSLTDLREDITAHMGKDTLERILAYKASPVDEEKAMDTMIHYSRWTAGKLEGALDYPHWIKFHVVEKPERLLSYVGLGSVGLGAGRVLWKRAATVHAQKKSAVVVVKQEPPHSPPHSPPSSQ